MYITLNKYAVHVTRYLVKMETSRGYYQVIFFWATGS